MYNGLGERIKGDGDGPESALALLGTIEHKTLLHDASAGDKTMEMLDSDRFYLVPGELEQTKWLPLSWMAELAQVLTMGGRVGVMSHHASTMAIVVDFLRRPDAFLASAQKAVAAHGAQMDQPETQSVGMLSDGAGNYLDGDAGQAVAWQADEAKQFRGFLSGSREAKARSGLLPTDRLYIMPADYLVAGALPLWIVAELMKTLYRGGKVLVIAPNEMAFNRLVKIVSEPEKLQLLVEPAAGRA
jgi:hypothetical protein